MESNICKSQSINFAKQKKDKDEDKKYEQKTEINGRKEHLILLDRRYFESKRIKAAILSSHKYFDDFDSVLSIELFPKTKKKRYHFSALH